MLKRKRIDVLTKYFYPVAAGIEINILETYSELVKLGWTVTVHTTKDTYTEKNILKDKELLRGLLIKRYSFGKFMFNPQINWQNTDLICLHNFNVLPHFFILVRSLILKLFGNKKFKLALIPHGGLTPEWSIFSKPIALVKKFYHFTVGTFLINNVVDVLRVVSLWERNEIESKGINRKIIHIIPNGLEDEAYLDVDKLASNQIKEQIKKFSPYIIQIGRIYKIKNIETAIKALAETNSQLKLVIVGPIEWGNSGYVEKLTSLIEKLNLKDRVIFLGVVRGIDKYYLIRHAEIMVHMAIWESFCNVVHEGMSQGLPCLVANNTALPLLIQNNVNGYCLDTFDFKSLARKINFVFQNKNSDFIKEMSSVNKKFARKESWKNIAVQLHKLYSLTVI